MNPNEPQQINDLNSPHKPQHTSKPIIVGHRPMMPDPMVNRPEHSTHPMPAHPKTEVSKDAPAIFEPPRPAPQPAQPTPIMPKPPVARPPPEPKHEFTPPPPLPTVGQNRPPAPSYLPDQPMEVHIPSGKVKQKTTKKILEAVVVLALIAAAFYAGQSL